MLLTVTEQVVLCTAWSQFFCLATAEPGSFLPELRVKLGQDRGVVFDLCRRRCSAFSGFFSSLSGELFL